MLYLAFIFHMHQPYYKNLLTQEASLPWVRLHGIKDYVDMVQILEKYPLIHQTFNLVPSLLEQVEDYTNRNIKDKFLELSYRPVKELNAEEKVFIRENFFSISKERVISQFPRYYELYFKLKSRKEFTDHDYTDLQVWFNLAWIDPSFRENIPELKRIVNKARFFTEEDKHAVLDKQLEILEETFPIHKKLMHTGQLEVTANPYYHPILPLLCSTNIAKEANPKTVLPLVEFAYPQDAQAQINDAIKFYHSKFGVLPAGMWPSEESVSEHVIPFIINAGIKWIVTDEAILFKSLKKRKRDTRLLYQPHLIKREEGELSIVFRDRNLSDLIGFEYYKWGAEEAAQNFMMHLENINKAFKEKDILVTIAMDGENAWEYYKNDGIDFLNSLYQKISAAAFIKTITISEYLKQFPPKNQIKRLAAGSWIFGDFGKWIGNPQKRKAWEYLALARQELEEAVKKGGVLDLPLAWKQMYICEGSDWFWWYGEDPQGDFDRLFRMHMGNLYTLIGKDIPDYLKKPI